MAQKLQNDEKPRLFSYYDTQYYMNYSIRCHELGCRLFDYFRHDLKNYQNAVLMALDLYRLKKDEKYLDKIDESSQKCLDYIGIIKTVENHIFVGGFLGFYSCFSTIGNAMDQYPSQSLKMEGEDCFVLADASFSSIFNLLFLDIFQEGKNSEAVFSVSRFEEDGIPKCRIDMTFRNFTVSKQYVEDILKEDSLSVTGNLFSLSLYIVKKIACRCEGTFLLKETTDTQTTFSLIMLSESDYVHNSLLKY